MVVRHHEIDFASGALVFPGRQGRSRGTRSGLGRAAPTPHRRRARLRRRGGARDLRGGGPGARPAPRHGSSMLEAPRRRTAWSSTTARRCSRAIRTFLDLVRGEGLLLATDLMVPFAHWITPGSRCPSASTRTSAWWRPRSSSSARTTARSRSRASGSRRSRPLRDADAGTRTLVFATHMNLKKLARYAPSPRPWPATPGDAGRHRHAEGRAPRGRAQAAHSRRGRLRRHGDGCARPYSSREPAEIRIDAHVQSR